MGSALLDAHPIGGGKFGPVFSLIRGRIDFRGDDLATQSFALGLAQRLGARVVGDEGEELTFAELLRVADDSLSGTINPFTGERIVNEWAGTVARVDRESHLEVTQRSFFGLRRSRERYLLHFVVPAASIPALSGGQAVRVRGELSEPGTYGAQGACSKVLYAMRVL